MTGNREPKRFWRFVPLLAILLAAIVVAGVAAAGVPTQGLGSNAAQSKGAKQTDQSNMAVLNIPRSAVPSGTKNSQLRLKNEAVVEHELNMTRLGVVPSSERPDPEKTKAEILARG